jgi:hypothetical protein
LTAADGLGAEDCRLLDAEGAVYADFADVLLLPGKADDAAAVEHWRIYWRARRSKTMFACK